MEPIIKDKNTYLWVMIWWAVGDALWSATEFLQPWQFTFLNEMQWSRKFMTKAGERTDDTAMTLCLAQSLIDCKWFDIIDQLDKYLNRSKTGYMSSSWKCIWIGQQTLEQLYKYKLYKEWKADEKPREQDLSWKRKDWNGSLMRIWPIALAYIDNPSLAIYYGWESCKTTHNSRVCIDACKYFVWLLCGSMLWASKAELLEPYYSPDEPWEIDKLSPELIPIIEGEYKNKSHLTILWGKYWYIIESLEIALWAFYHYDTFEEWLATIVNLGNDADTNWCIYWFLAWAYYWYDNIPKRWSEKIAKFDLIQSVALQLYDLELSDNKW